MDYILNDQQFQQKLVQLAIETGQSHLQVHQEAEGYLKELYATHQPFANIAAIELSNFILSRGYDKTIDVNPVELKALAKLMRKHPVAFVMTHKTYIDMLVLALVLARHGLPLPYTFAGINMNMAGLGAIGKQSGFIFIRRSFKDNPVYKATLRHFIATKVNERSHFMWSIEGTRSRTGKLVWPKMGILKYIRDAEQDSKEQVQYVPVSIVYDLIPDVVDMTKEGRGKAKQAESLTWFLDYIRRMSSKFGRISIRFGDPVGVKEELTAPIPDKEDGLVSQNELSRFAFELVHRINQVTPVTTASLICTTLLSKYALPKRAIESDVSELMQIIESHKPDALVDRGKPIGESVRVALRLLQKAQLVFQDGAGLNVKYVISTKNYLPANYYANMSAHHLYRRAFIELAFEQVRKIPAKNRLWAFWECIMRLRDLFKFEFFYSNKATFCDEVEKDLAFIAPNWNDILQSSDGNVWGLLQSQQLMVAPAVLYTYIEAYQVVGQALMNWNSEQVFDDNIFIKKCLTLGEEMKWQGKIQRIETVSKPFLVNGLRLAKNRKLIPTSDTKNKKARKAFIKELNGIALSLKRIQEISLTKLVNPHSIVPVERDIVPGSKTDGITSPIIEGEEGAHIGAFFDLDRTLISDFSAKQFVQTRVLSGKMTSREVVAQLAGVFLYATGNKNFAALAAMGAKGVKGVPEQVFLDVGEEVYQKHLADIIYPESRALVAAHLSKGHTVAIVSAATPYQVVPVARDVGIEHVMCTRMEVKDGKFTGEIIEPACWGEGKAYAGKELAKELQLDLSKSYFYTDSAEDMPLLEIVGNPRPINPDAKLSNIAYQNGWPVYRFDDAKPSKTTNLVRTVLAASSLVPGTVMGVLAGINTMSWSNGINTMIGAVSDLVTSIAGVNIVVKGEQHLWTHRPAVFLINHQSNMDMFIVTKLIRKDITGIAKKELKNYPLIGQLLQASGVIFIDRKNREKAIEAMQPAVDALKGGTSIVIFPEGTRSYSYELGAFKKGAFHLAMQAAVPLIPIILKNAHDALPRGKALIQPSFVEVTVLPPIPTKNWKKEDLNTHIEETRNLFLNELGQDDKEVKGMPISDH